MTNTETELAGISTMVAGGVFWYVWGKYGVWWGLWYGLGWAAWAGYRLAEYLLP